MGENRRDPDTDDIRRVLRADAAAPLPEIPGVTILGEQKSGGFGTVYKALQVREQRLVAVKVASPGRMVDLIEAQIVARFSDPHIVTLYGTGFLPDGRVYLLLEWVDGGTLADKLTTKQTGVTVADPRQVAEMIEIVARALEQVHRVGITHRDLKPANLLVSRQGDQSEWFKHIKISDFGLATKELAASPAGTRTYMAPEFFPDTKVSGRPPTPFSDVYSLGIVLYECLTGQRPEPCDLRREPLPSPRRLNPAIPKTLATICEKCLCEEPLDRYGRNANLDEPKGPAERLADDLRNFLEDRETYARPLSRGRRLLLQAKRSPGWAAFFAALVLLLAAAGIAISEGEKRRSLEELRRQGAEEMQREAERREEETKAKLSAERTARREDERSAALAYARLLREAQLALDRKNSPAALAVLDLCPPRLRGWEWHHLFRQCEGNIRTVRFNRAVRALAVGGEGRDGTAAEKEESGSFPLQVAVTLDDGRTHLGGWNVAWAETPPRFREWADRDFRQLVFAREPGLLLIGSSAESKQVHHGIVSRYSLVTGDKLESWIEHYLEDDRHREAPVGWTARMAMHPDGRTLVRAGSFGALTVTDLSGTNASREFGQGEHQLPILGLTFSPDGKWLATCGGTSRGERHKGELVLWSWPEPAKVNRREFDHPIRGVSFASDAKSLVVFDTAGTVSVFGIEGRTVRFLENLPLRDYTSVDCMAHHPNDPRILITAGGTSFGELIRWERAGGQIRSDYLLGHDRPVTALAFDPSGDYLLSGDAGGTVRVWKTRAATDPPEKGGTERIALDRSIRPPGGRVEANVNGKTVSVRVSDGDQPYDHRPITSDAPVVGLALNGRGDRIAVLDERGRVKVLDVSTGVTLLELPTLLDAGAPQGLGWTERNELLVRWPGAEWRGK